MQGLYWSMWSWSKGKKVCGVKNQEHCGSQLTEGDKNTKFFHRIANAHRRYNNIDQLIVLREITQEQPKIEGEIIDFYKKLYTETAQWRATLKDVQFPIKIEEEKEALQANF